MAWLYSWRQDLMAAERKAARSSRVRYFDFDKNREVEGRVEEVNGSMAYVRDDDGNADWRDRRELRRGA